MWHTEAFVHTGNNNTREAVEGSRLGTSWPASPQLGKRKEWGKELHCIHFEKFAQGVAVQSVATETFPAHRPEIPQLDPGSYT